MKKLVICLLAVLLLLGSGGCGSSEKSGPPDIAPGTVTEETENSITIVDMAHRQVKVPKKIQSIALCYRVAIRFLLNLDQGDKIAGIGKSEPFLEEVQPSLAKARDVGKGVADIEALADLNPDLFIHKASDVEGLEAVQELGIPSIGIRAETEEDMVTVLTILGKICGEEEKAKELIGYYNEKMEKDRELTKKIKEKKTAVVMGSSIGKVADGTMLQSRMIETAGGRNPAKGIEATELWPTVGTEQIFKWNPDFIFITNSESAMYTAQDILTDPNWSELTAVKEKHVYTMPAAKDSWEFPGIVSALGIDYMIHTMYPDLLSEKELEKNAGDLYRLAYGKAFSRKELGY